MSTEEGLEELDEELTDDEDSDIELPPINLSDIFAKEYEKWTHQEEDKPQEEPQGIQDRKDPEYQEDSQVIQNRKDQERPQAKPQARKDQDNYASPRWDRPDAHYLDKM